MKWSIILFLVPAHHNLCGQSFQLAPPILKYSSAFFKDSVVLSILFDQPGAKIRYTTNGSDPGENELPYKEKIILHSSAIIKARTFGQSFKPSEVVTAIFFRDGKTIRRINHTKPADAYSSSNPRLLHDNLGGFPDFRNGQWLGFNRDSVLFEIILEKEEKISSLMINMLRDENNWIFLPDQISVFVESPGKNSYTPMPISVQHQAGLTGQCSFTELLLEKSIHTTGIRVFIRPLASIPKGHPGEGKPGWLFVDEIKVN